MAKKTDVELGFEICDSCINKVKKLSLPGFVYCKCVTMSVIREGTSIHCENYKCKEVVN